MESLIAYLKQLREKKPVIAIDYVIKELERHQTNRNTPVSSFRPKYDHDIDDVNCRYVESERELKTYHDMEVR